MKHSKISAEFLSEFCMELALILRTGLPIADGLLMLKDDYNNKATKEIIAKIYSYAESGQPLSSSLDATNAFPHYLINMIKLAEQTGKLANTLAALSAYYQRQERLSHNIRNSILYPSILLVTMIIIVVVLTTKVLPVFNNVFIQMGTNISPFAAKIMHWGDNFSYVALIITAFIVIIFLIALIIKCFPRLKAKIFSFFKKYFGCHGINGRIASARFASSMAMAISSGINIEDALISAAEICGGSKTIDTKIHSCQSDIKSGYPTSQALSMSGLFSVRDSRMLLMAEKTGTMTEVMTELALRNQQKIEDDLDRIIGYIEPILVLITSIIVGVIILSVMLPLISIMSSIG